MGSVLKNRCRRARSAISNASFVVLAVLERGLEPMLQHRVVRSGQHRQAFQRAGGPVGRSRIAQYEFVERHADAIAEIAARVAAVGLRDLKHPQRTAALEIQRRG